MRWAGWVLRGALGLTPTAVGLWGCADPSDTVRTSVLQDWVGGWVWVTERLKGDTVI